MEIKRIKTQKMVLSKQLRTRLFLLLPLLLVGLSGCKPKENVAGQSLANTGSKTAGTLASYYESLAEDVNQQPELEIFYRGIQKPTLPDFQPQDYTILEQEALALRHRAKMAHDLESVYVALQNLSSYNASTEVNKSVDNLTGSLKQISTEPKIFGVNTSDVLKPVLNGLVEWKRSRSIEKGVKTIQPTLIGIKKLVDEEKGLYTIITDRRYTMLIGNRATTPDQLCIAKTVGTVGVADYLIKTQSMSLQFLLQQIPELKELPWNSQAVKDPATKCAIVRSLNLTLTTLESKSKDTPTELSNSLQELIEQHKKFLQKQPLTLTDVLAYQEQAQIYLDLLNKFRTKKNTQ
ncbi:MAG: hypothetical protein PUP92_38365 [Rhizonema sp. PD38]|nr:hypothetical protein [Rhizonema sp. PD38]